MFSLNYTIHELSTSHLPNEFKNPIPWYILLILVFGLILLFVLCCYYICLDIILFGINPNNLVTNKTYIIKNNNNSENYINEY